MIARRFGNVKAALLLQVVVGVGFVVAGVMTGKSILFSEGSDRDFMQFLASWDFMGGALVMLGLNAYLALRIDLEAEQSSRTDGQAKLKKGAEGSVIP